MTDHQYTADQEHRAITFCPINFNQARNCLPPKCRVPCQQCLAVIAAHDKLSEERASSQSRPNVA